MKKRTKKLSTLRATIDWLGTDGDGVAHDAEKHLYLPLTLPGELVEAEIDDGRHGIATAILEPSRHRVTPPCRHFGTCGGCTLQHAADDFYAAWKTDLLRRALQRAGFPDPPIAELQRSPPRARRRVDLALRRHPNGITVGLHERHSEDIVDLQECHVLNPTLMALLKPLRDTLPRLNGFRRHGSAIINLLDSGPDLLLRTDAPLSAADRTLLAAFATAHGLPRVSHAITTGEPETACLLRPPTTMLSGTPVSPPPGAFLQATPHGETAIIAAVLAGLPERLPPKSWIAELYAGIGTLTHPLAARAPVRAWDSNAAAISALRAAANPRITATARDLARQPLRRTELAGAAAAILDPPWSGAPAQVAELATPTVIYVSCNPSSLARDAAVLRDHGYQLAAALPIDQFLWSARLEGVVTFAR